MTDRHRTTTQHVQTIGVDGEQYREHRTAGWWLPPGLAVVVLVVLALLVMILTSGCSAQPIARAAATFDRATFLRSFTVEWSRIVDTITEDEALAILDSNGDGEASYAEIHVGQVLLRNIVCANLGSPTGNTADDYRQHMAVKLSWDAAEGDQ